MATQEISEADIRSFGSKLSAFADTLTEKEQAVLLAVLNRASAASDEVRGYAAPIDGIVQPNPLSSQGIIAVLIGLTYPPTH